MIDGPTKASGSRGKRELARLPGDGSVRLWAQGRTFDALVSKPQVTNAAPISDEPRYPAGRVIWASQHLRAERLANRRMKGGVWRIR